MGSIRRPPKARGLPGTWRSAEGPLGQKGAKPPPAFHLSLPGGGVSCRVAPPAAQGRLPLGGARRNVPVVAAGRILDPHPSCWEVRVCLQGVTQPEGVCQKKERGQLGWGSGVGVWREALCHSCHPRGEGEGAKGGAGRLAEERKRSSGKRSRESLGSSALKPPSAQPVKKPPEEALGLREPP